MLQLIKCIFDELRVSSIYLIIKFIYFINKFYYQIKEETLNSSNMHLIKRMRQTEEIDL